MTQYYSSVVSYYSLFVFEESTIYRSFFMRFSLRMLISSFGYFLSDEKNVWLHQLFTARLKWRSSETHERRTCNHWRSTAVSRHFPNPTPRYRAVGWTWRKSKVLIGQVAPFPSTHIFFGSLWVPGGIFGDRKSGWLSRNCGGATAAVLGISQVSSQRIYRQLDMYMR